MIRLVCDVVATTRGVSPNEPVQDAYRDATDSVYLSISIAIPGQRVEFRVVSTARPARPQEGKDE
jgi:hypothetical protein